MPHASHAFDGRHRRQQRDEASPYFFRRESADVLEEALQELLHARLRDASAPRPDEAAPPSAEEEVLREHWVALFAYDAQMQRVFHGNVEAFCTAMQHPEYMHEHLAAYLRELHERGGDRGDGMHAWQQTPQDWVGHTRIWEEDSEGGAELGDDPLTLDEDPVYDEAFRWACRVERWSRKQYAERDDRDQDLFRVLVNVPAVAAKIAYGYSGGLDDDLVGLEIALMGYQQAELFLQRVLDALASCHAKRIGKQAEVHDFIDRGRELVADLEARRAEIDSELRFRRKESE